jgi:hypothetical protein
MVFYSADTNEWYMGKYGEPGFFAKATHPVSDTSEPPISGWMCATATDAEEISEDLFFAQKDAWDLLAKRSSRERAKDRHSIMDALLLRRS